MMCRSCPPSDEVAAMPDEAIVSAILCCDRIFPRINGIKNVLSVPTWCVIKAKDVEVLYQ